ncbi:RHS repeat protein, partial [Paenibacillus spiritus]
MLAALLSVTLLTQGIPAERSSVYADSADNSVALNNLATTKAIYDIAVNTPNNGIAGGEEVSNLTGTMTLTATDLVFPGRNGLDVSLTRVYSTRDSNLSNPRAITSNTSAPYYYSNDSSWDKYTWNEKRYNLGAGWSFAFPSVEFRGTEPFLHMTDGNVYRIAGTGSARTIEGYPLQDKTFSAASGTIGGMTAAYKLTDLDQTSVYFDDSGRWIGTRDAYGNEVAVAYVTKPVFGGTSVPLIASITSTGGRVIAFDYPDANTVTVTYPIDGTRSGKLVYNKTALAGQTNEMVLSSVDTYTSIDSANSANSKKLTTSYTYSPKTAAFDYETADTTKANGSIVYALLNKVTYPTGASSNYSYENTPQKKFLGAAGYLEYYRLSERYDSLKGPAGTAQRTGYTKYSYDAKNFSGYGVSGETDPDNRTASFSVTNSMRTFTDPDTASPSQDRLVESKTYSSKYLLTSYTAEKQGEYKQTTTYSYDAQVELPTAVRDTFYSIDGSQGSSYTEYQYTYDPYGNVLTETDPKNYKTTYAYHSTFRGIPVSKTTAYGSAGSSPVTEKIIQTVSPTKPEVSKVEQKYKNKPTDTAEQTDTTEFTYDAYGNVLTTKRLLENNRSQLTTYTYDSNSLFPVSVKQNVTKNGTTRTIEEKYEFTSGTGWEKGYLDPNAVKAGTSAASSRKYETEYDLTGRVTKIKSSMVSGESAKPERTFSYTYDTANQTYTVQGVDEEGNKTVSLYDGLGRIREVKAPSANTVMDSTTASHTPVTKQTFTYNGLGEVIGVKDGNNHTITYEYDNLGRVKQETTSLGQVLGHSYNDVLHSSTTTRPITSSTTATTEITSDELGRMTNIKQLNSDPTKSEVLQRSIAYEVGGDPFQVQTIDGRNNTATYKGNGLGLVTEVQQNINGINQTATYGYNKLRKITNKSVDGQILASYDYNELGQRVSKADATSGIETYNYDDNGNLTDGTDRLGNPARHTYDERNQLTGWDYGSVGSAVTATFTYYKNGLRKSMTDETGTTQYQYNRDLTLRGVTYPDGKTIQYEYDNAGNRTKMTDPFGAITLYAYDDDNRLTKVSFKANASAVESTQATYVYSGSVLDKITYGNGLVTQYFYEDGFGRLTKVQHLKGSSVINEYKYSYDGNGNITQRTSNGKTETFAYDELDRIISSTEGNEQYSYDKKGNRLVQLSTATSISTDSVNFTYDKANQLKSVTRNGIATSYKYDGDGLMRERTSGGKTTRFYYDGQNIIAEGSVSGNSVSFQTRYIRGSQLISMTNQSGAQGYYLLNGHGDVVSLYKQDQTLLSTYDYDIWGN